MKTNSGVLFLCFGLAMSVSAATENASLSENIGDKVTVSASDHAIFSNAKDDVDRSAAATNVLLNEGKVRAEYGSTNADIHFTNRYAPSKADTNKYFSLEKKSLGLETAAWDIKLGDTHQELGRGIALSLYSEPAFGIDNTLEGGSVKYRPSGVEAAAFAGRVNVLKYPVNINPLDMLMKNRDVYVAATSVNVAATKDTKIGGHFLYTLDQRLDNHTFQKRNQTAGLTFSQENIFDSVDAYAESNLMLTDKLTPTTSKTLNSAKASYAALSWSPSPWKVKVDVKDYRNYEYDFRRPPSLEEDVPLNQVPNNYTDITAVRLFGERRFEGSGTTVYSSFLTGEDRVETTHVHHALVGSKLPVTKGLEFELRTGYRWMPDYQDIKHASVKAKVKTFKGQMVELEARKQYSNLQLRSSPAKEDRNIFGLTYTFNETFNMSLGYEWIPTNDDESGKNFANIGAAYKVGALSSRAFVGQTSGGTQCAGGVCRQAPAYTGAMLEANYAF